MSIKCQNFSATVALKQVPLAQQIISLPMGFREERGNPRCEHLYGQNLIAKVLFNRSVVHV